MTEFSSELNVRQVVDMIYLNTLAYYHQLAQYYSILH